MQSQWNEQAAWSKTADRLKAAVTLWRKVVLALTICGAALETLAATLHPHPAWTQMSQWVAGVGAVALALIPFLNHAYLTPNATRKWLRARSVAEGMKSELYTFMAGAEPYDKPNPFPILLGKISTIEGWVNDLSSERALTGQVERKVPAVASPSDYLSLRVDQQIIKYYRPNATTNAQSGRRYQQIATALGATAAVLSAMATVPGGPGPDLGAWIAVITTIAGTIAAHAAANQYDAQAQMYQATARQLEDLAEAWMQSNRPAGSSKEWSEFVRACEESISATNRAWMAKLDPQ